jgi:hypothetical protein
VLFLVRVILQPECKVYLTRNARSTCVALDRAVDLEKLPEGDDRGQGIPEPSRA